MPFQSGKPAYQKEHPARIAISVGVHIKQASQMEFLPRLRWDCQLGFEMITDGSSMT